MHRNWKQFSPPYKGRPHGLTLIEVVVGMGILGALLVGILLADTRTSGQTRRANERIEACKAADELLRTWWFDWSGGKEFPRGGSGAVSGRAGWTWETEILPPAGAADLNADVVAVRIFTPDRQEPAASVEVLMPRRLFDNTQRGQTP
jgi:prepilin-type N-terminal cleavage/methylation domain-containing protein